MRTRGREGVKNPENFAYVLNGSPPTKASIYTFQSRGRVGSTEGRSDHQNRQTELAAPHQQAGAANTRPPLPTTPKFLAQTRGTERSAEPEEGARPGAEVGLALLTSGLLLPRRRDGGGGTGEGVRSAHARPHNL